MTYFQDIISFRFRYNYRCRICYGHETARPLITSFTHRYIMLPSTTTPSILEI